MSIDEIHSLTHIDPLVPRPSCSQIVEREESNFENSASLEELDRAMQMWASQTRRILGSPIGSTIFSSTELKVRDYRLEARHSNRLQKCGHLRGRI